MTLTLILVASVTVNIILLLLVNYISKKRAEIMLGVWKFKEEKKIRNDAHARIISVVLVFSEYPASSFAFTTSPSASSNKTDKNLFCFAVRFLVILR